MADMRVQQSTNKAGYLPKILDEGDIKYWWSVLEGKKLVKAKDYKFNPQIAMFTEKNLPEPIRILEWNEEMHEEENPGGEQDYRRYTLWVDEDRVCVKLEIS